MMSDFYIARRNQGSYIGSSQVPGWKKGHPEIQTFPGSVPSQQVIDPGCTDPTTIPCGLWSM